MEESIFLTHQNKQLTKEQQQITGRQESLKQDRKRQEELERQRLFEQKKQQEKDRQQKEINGNRHRSALAPFQDMSVDIRQKKEKRKAKQKAPKTETVAGLSTKEVHGSFSEERRDAFQEVLREDCMASTFKKMSDSYKKAIKAVADYSKLDLNNISFEDRSEYLLKARKAVEDAIASHEKNLNSGKEKKMDQLQKELTVLRRYDLYFNTFNTGHLEVPEGAVKRQCTDMKLHAKGFSLESGGGPVWKDVGKRKLFDGEPCIQDVCQGNLGDCYLQAGLASLVTNNPEYIKNCMTENEDGTVTVRLYRKDGDKMTAEYITVTKDIPAWSKGTAAYNHGPLWVHMIEKAYAASGFHFTDEQFRERLEVNAREQLVKELGRRPNYQETEARVELLFQKYKNSYNRIEGGNTDKFLEILTGVKAERVFQDQVTALNVDYIFDRVLTDQEAMKTVTFMRYNDMDMIFTELCREIRRQHVKTYRTKEGIEGRYVTGALTIEDLSEALANMDKWEEKQAYATFLFSIMKEFPDKSDEDVNLIIREKLTELSHWMERYFETLKGNTTLQHRMFATRTDGNGVTTAKYTHQAEQCYEEILKALGSKKNLNLGTRSFIPPGVNSAGLNGEAQSLGIVERHAYTIIGCEEVDGHKYIRIRNPWGTVERGYKKITTPGKNGEPAAITYQGVEIREQKGQFRMELNDFMNRVGTIYGIS